MDRFTKRDWEFLYILVARRLRYEEKRGLKFQDTVHEYKLKMMRSLVNKLQRMMPLSPQEEEAAWNSMEDYSDEST